MYHVPIGAPLGSRLVLPWTVTADGEIGAPSATVSTLHGPSSVGSVQK